MNIEFGNHWECCSMKDGGCFPITFFEIYADIHSTYRFCNITILNFSMTIQFQKKRRRYLADGEIFSQED